MPKYLISVTDEDAKRLESWLGGAVLMIPRVTNDPLADLRGDGGDVPDHHRPEADRRLGQIRAVTIAGLDAVSDAELRSVDERLRTGFAIYHAGGPEPVKPVYRVTYARNPKSRRFGETPPRHIAVYDMRDPGKRTIRMNKTLCNVFAAHHPESGAQGELSAATCRPCIREYTKREGAKP